MKPFTSSLVALWLILVWRGVPVHAITITPANPTIGVDQTQQFTTSGAVTPTAVAAGGWHTCMRLPDGTVRCAGRNNFGQLGNGDSSLKNSSVAVAVRGLTTATSVVTGAEFTCAVLGDRTVQCWGSGDSGQRGDGTFNNISTVPVAVVGITNASAVVTRGFHACALLGDATVQCWGRNSEGQLGVTPSGTPCPTTPEFFCSSTPVQVGEITNAAAITAGGYHTCALFLPEGTVGCWGRNDQGQLGNGTRTSSSTPVQVAGIAGVAAVSGGGYHVCALLPDGTVHCWGENTDGQLGIGIPGGVSTIPVRVVGITGAVAVAGGWKHTCALLGDGTIQCWGRNEFGQLGDGTTTSSSAPVRVVDITGAVAVGAGGSHTCALLSDGGVKCWGENDFGELGHGTTTNSSTPVPVIGTAVAWTSSDSGVATVDAAGLATGVRPGFATITATDSSGASASTMLTVRERVTLSVVRAGAGSGSVSSSPPGISCGTDCSESYDKSTAVILTAAPASGSTFNNWTECDTVSGTTCTVTMSSARVVTATFDLQRFTLMVNTAGIGSGTVTSSDGSINCGAACSASYDSGTRVTLTATPAPFNAFMGWSGGGCNGTGTCAVTLSAPTTVTATFAPTFALTVAKAGAGSGTVTSSPPGIDCGAICAAFYPSGTVVTLTMASGTNSVFTGWRGAGCSGTGTCTLTLTAVTTVTALVGVDTTFTDDPLVPQSTVVKPVHITEVRQDVDAFRVAHGLAPFAWTDPLLASGTTEVKAVHLLELRSALDQAYQAAGLAIPIYTDPTVEARVTVIKASHLNELRTAVRALR